MWGGSDKTADVICDDGNHDKWVGETDEVGREYQNRRHRRREDGDNDGCTGELKIREWW